MKYFGLMRYILKMEVWKSSEGIFSNQGKYAMEILRRFDMLDCKFMGTSMDTNMKLLYDETSELVDMNQYRHFIGSLIYLTIQGQIYALL